MKANQEIEIGVMNIINRFAEAFTRRDLEAMMALYVPDPDVVVIGTGGDEKRVGLADIIGVLVDDGWIGFSVMIASFVASSGDWHPATIRIKKQIHKIFFFMILEIYLGIFL